MVLLVDKAAFPYKSVLDASIRKAMREGSHSRYALFELDIDDDYGLGENNVTVPEVNAYARVHSASILSVPSRASLWEPSRDPTCNTRRWAYEIAGADRKTALNLAKRNPEDVIDTNPRRRELAQSVMGIIHTLEHTPEDSLFTWISGPSDTEGAIQGNRDYILVDTDEELEKVMALHPWNTMTALDFETTGSQPYVTIVGFSFSWIPGLSYYVPWQATPVQYRALLKIISGPWVAHNAQYEILCLRSIGLERFIGPEDTMILAWEQGLPRGLKKLALKELGVRMTTFEEVSKGRPFDQVPLAEATQYAAADADMTLQLLPILEKSDRNRHLYEQIDKPIIPVLADMKARGLRLNGPWYQTWRDSLDDELKRLEAKIRYVGQIPPGKDFNPASTADVQWLLFTHLDLPPQKFVAKGYATDKDTLYVLATAHAVVPVLIKHRQVSKRKDQYGDGFLRTFNAFGRIHSDFDGSGTVTGRLSAKGPEWFVPTARGKLRRQKGPQMQNVPLVAREGVIADENHLLVGADYGQIELRILAHRSGDPKFVEAFREGRSPHVETMQGIFGVNDVHFDGGKPYKLSKNINFGIPYGAGPARLVAVALEGGIVVSVAEMESHLSKHRQLYSVTWDYRERRIAEIVRLGYSETLQGRRNTYPNLYAADMGLRGEAEREAFNADIQGTSGDFTKAAMVEWARLGLQERWPIVIQAHDEIDLQVPEAEVLEAGAKLRQVMIDVAQPYLSLPVEVDVKWGKTWKDLK